MRGPDKTKYTWQAPTWRSAVTYQNSAGMNASEFRYEIISTAYQLLILSETLNLTASRPRLDPALLELSANLGGDKTYNLKSLYTDAYSHVLSVPKVEEPSYVATSTITIILILTLTWRILAEFFG